jgi:lipoprotein LprG
MSPRTRAGAHLGWVVVLVAVLAVAGCGSKSAKDLGDPATVLKTAAQKLAATSGVALTLATPNLPEGTSGIKGAAGTVTNAPAFDGTLTVVISAGSFAVPVRSVGGQVYAQIPLTPGWSKVNPSDYGAPDPANLTSADKGLPAILTATTGSKAGNQVRGGTDNKEVFTAYTGKVPGSAVANIIPGASGDFSASYAIDDSGELRQASLTGVFYSGKPALTYTLTLSGYGTGKDITAP